MINELTAIFLTLNVELPRWFQTDMSRVVAFLRDAAVHFNW
jgi:hypothetical protein